MPRTPDNSLKTPQNHFIMSGIDLVRVGTLSKYMKK
jgi:hypothetical protein